MWDSWNNVDVEYLNNQVEEINNNNDFEEVPDGKYEVRLESLEMKPTKEMGYPMIAASFTIVEGKYTKRKIFVNKVLLRGRDSDKYSVADCNKFLTGLRADGVKIRFGGVKIYAASVDDAAAISIGREYLMEKKTNSAGFANYNILEIYE